MSSKIKIPEAEPRRSPNDRERRAFDRAAKRYDDRPQPLVYAKQPAGHRALALKPEHSDEAGQMLHTLDTFGTASCEFAEHGVGRLAAVMRCRGEDLPTDTALSMSLAAVGGIAPQNETEAMLAVQMVGTHEVAMEMLTRAKLATDPGQIERYGTFATKLLRTYATQIEALAKIRRGGSQKVVVEHVHVYQGGQAIVGAVTVPEGGGGQLENGHQPHALAEPAALALQAVPAVLCPDAGRDTVPGACGSREDAVPDARRGRRKRSAQG